MSVVEPAQVVCVDLDSTLTDTRHRRDLCPTVNPDCSWDDYHAACAGDAPVTGVVTLVRMLVTAGYGIHIVTNRSARFYEKTVAWLTQHNVPHHHLAMRPGDIALEDTNRWKLQYLAYLDRVEGYEVRLFIEDWPETANAIEAAGVPVLCINPRYATAPVPA